MAGGGVGGDRPSVEPGHRGAVGATLLEMGGNGPLVVMDDADLSRAVEGILAACFLCAGQSCTAG